MNIKPFINVPGALGIIKDGQMIEVDGVSGRVYLEMSESNTESEGVCPNGIGRLEHVLNGIR